MWSICKFDLAANTIKLPVLHVHLLKRAQMHGIETILEKQGLKSRL